MNIYQQLYHNLFYLFLSQAIRSSTHHLQYLYSYTFITLFILYSITHLHITLYPNPSPSYHLISSTPLFIHLSSLFYYPNYILSFSSFIQSYNSFHISLSYIILSYIIISFVYHLSNLLMQTTPLEIGEIYPFAANSISTNSYFTTSNAKCMHTSISMIYSHYSCVQIYLKILLNLHASSTQAQIIIFYILLDVNFHLLTHHLQLYVFCKVFLYGFQVFPKDIHFLLLHLVMVSKIPLKFQANRIKKQNLDDLEPNLQCEEASILPLIEQRVDFEFLTVCILNKHFQCKQFFQKFNSFNVVHDLFYQLHDFQVQLIFHFEKLFFQKRSLHYQLIVQNTNQDRAFDCLYRKLLLYQELFSSCLLMYQFTELPLYILLKK